MGRHQAARLVMQEEPGALARRQRRAVDRDAVLGADIDRRRGDDLAVDRDAARRDPGFRRAARGKTRARDHLGDALARSCFARVAVAGHLSWPGLSRPSTSLVSSRCIKTWMPGTSLPRI